MMLWHRQRGGETSPRRLPSAGGGRSRTRRLVVALAALAVLAASWFFLAPAKLGGSTDYVATYGVSMEPRFHTGDLAVVRAHRNYQVGQIVAYDNLELGRVVLHRIIGRIGDRYVFKGDNNDFVDPYHPTRSQLIGQLWLRVPRGGLVLSWLRSPHHAALVSGLVVLFLLGGAGGSASRRRRPPRTAGPGTSRVVVAEVAQPLLGVAVVAALACGLLLAISHDRSTTRTFAVPGYVQQGAYTYSAHASPGAVYPSGRLTTGQTVFTKLVHRVRLGFSYRFRSALPHTVHGEAHVLLALHSSLGWTASLPSPAGRAFTSDTVTLSQLLNVAALETDLSRYLATTGIVNDSFTLTVTPLISVQGTVSGQPVQSAFEPNPLTFILDPSTLRLAQTTSGGSLPGQPAADPLHPSAAGTTARSAPGTLRILGRAALVSNVRRDALLGLLGAAVLAALALMAAQAGARADEATRIRRQHTELLVSVPAAPAMPADGFVDVESFADLARIAATHERVVLSSRASSSDSFYVSDDGAIYRYTARAPEAAASWSARVLACSRALSDTES